MDTDWIHVLHIDASICKTNLSNFKSWLFSMTELSITSNFLQENSFIHISIILNERKTNPIINLRFIEI